MSRIQVNHIKTFLDQKFKSLIDMNDFRGNEEERRNAFFSRALAAYSLHILANVPPDVAAASITDSYDDNGIDAVFYDEQQNTLYLVQSKMIAEGNGEPGTGDMRKFKDGIFDLIEERYDRFNSKLNAKLSMIADAFSNSQIKLNLLLSYTGKGFSSHNQDIIKDLTDKLNEATDWAYFTDFNLKFAHDSLNTLLDGKPVNAEISLSNWGTIDEPYTSYYGQISTYDLAQLWNHHRKMLFTENIRNFIGMSEINTSITKTIEAEPEHFVYFNNGVTILCNEITPLPAKTVGRTTGLFDCKGLSIINGAQTVGSLGMSIEKNADKLSRGRVFVRIIPLNKCPEGFGSRITISSNTQNRIEKRDFVSLDPLQLRLRTELMLLGINYHYKRSDEAIPYDEKNCTLEEATVALACFQLESTYCVTAKREIGKLWDGIEGEPYKKLFCSDLKAHVLWRVIETYRAVIKKLSEIKPHKTGKDSSICTYGNYFILHIVFLLVQKELIYDPNTKYENYLKENLPNMVETIYNIVCEVSEKQYPSSLIHQLFRNYTKCTEIEKIVVKKYTDNPNFRRVKKLKIKRK